MIEEIIDSVKREIAFAVKNNKNLDGASWQEETGVLFTYNEAKAVVDELEQFKNNSPLPNINNWVAVFDRKPDSILGTYIVCLENEHVLEMAYSSMTGNWWINGGSKECIDNPVAYWMKMPEPPCC